MGIEYGEYFAINACFELPCNLSGLLELLTKDVFHFNFEKLQYYKKMQKEINYADIMSGAYDYFDKNILSIEDFTKNTLISTEAIIDNHASCRIILEFYDDKSYGISTLFGNEDIEQGKISDNFIKKYIKYFYETLNPLYGNFGIEAYLFGVSTIITKEECTFQNTGMYVNGILYESNNENLMANLFNQIYLYLSRKR